MDGILGDNFGILGLVWENKFNMVRVKDMIEASSVKKSI